MNHHARFRLLCSTMLSLTLIAVLGCSESPGGGGDTGTGDGGGDDGGSDGQTSSNATGDGGDTGGGDGGETDGDTGGTTGGGEYEEWLDAIEEACEADCEAKLALECAPENQNVLTCKLQCASATGQLGEFCLAEYEAYVSCRAEGGYECVQDYPRPLATCTSQQVAYSECTMDLGCKRYCAESIEMGCTDASWDDCFAACTARGDELPESCGYRYNGFALCLATYGDMCEGDNLVTNQEVCAYNALDIADCIADESQDPCEGWCWAADNMGCGDGCTTECQANIADETCGQAYEEMIDCALLLEDATCQDGSLVGIDSCASDMQTWQECTSG